ncbi:hypothetical protein PRNP1_009661 [Phytophthora ramorum]
MRFLLVLLVTGLVLIASSDAFELPVYSNDRSITAQQVREENRTRRLRGSTSPDEEERGLLMSIKMAVKTTYLAGTGKSDDIVKKALKLDELTLPAMRASPNYKFYLQYLHKADGIKMDKLLSHKTSPTRVWIKFGLQQMDRDERFGHYFFKAYLRYATKYDNKVYHNGYPPHRPWSDAEMDALLMVWAKARRPDSYVLKRLGFNKMNKNYSKDFKTFKEYMEFHKKFASW